MDNNNKYSYAEHVKNRELLAFIFFERYSLDKALENKLLGATYSNSRLASLAEKAKKIFACLGGSSSYHNRIFSFCLSDAVRNNFNDSSFFVENETLYYSNYREKATLEFYKTLINGCKKYALLLLERQENILIDNKDKFSISSYENKCSKDEATYFFKHMYSLDHIRGYCTRAFDDHTKLLSNLHRDNIFYGTLLDFCNNDLSIFLAQLEVSSDTENGKEKLYNENSEKQIAGKLFKREFKVRLVVAFSDAVRKKIDRLVDNI